MAGGAVQLTPAHLRLVGAFVLGLPTAALFARVYVHGPESLEGGPRAAEAPVR